MARTTIRDGQFRIIGYVEDLADGRQRALNFRSQIIGYYDPSRDRTVDPAYRVITTGNTLAGLIYEAA